MVSLSLMLPSMCQTHITSSADTHIKCDGGGSSGVDMHFGPRVISFTRKIAYETNEFTSGQSSGCGKEKGVFDGAAARVIAHATAVICGQHDEWIAKWSWLHRQRSGRCFVRKRCFLFRTANDKMRTETGVCVCV